MIEFTIKTLDSTNHEFSVDDEMTVEELKTHVLEKMDIQIDLQRLIFCGRVMQDDQKLKDYDINGKVIHLVQRAPPDARNSGMSSSSGSNNTGNRTETSDRSEQHDRHERQDRHDHENQNRPERQSAASNPAMQQQIRRLMALTPEYLYAPPQPSVVTATTSRLEFIRRVIVDIKVALAQLRAQVNDEENSGAPASSEASIEPMDNEPTPGATQEPEPILDENGDEVADHLTRAQNARRRSYRAIRALRARQARPRDLAQLVEELDALHEQFTPFRTTYIRLLRAANDPEPPQYTDEEREQNQLIVDVAGDLMHSFSHAYHAVSDISFQVGQSNPRLTADNAVLRHPIPMQAHINVVQSGGNRRPAQQQSNNDGAANGASVRSSGTEASGNTANSGENQQSNRSASVPSAGRNATQPTVNINIQPDPITYQVEIETRVPIAFPIENALFSGLNNAANTNNSQPTEQNQQNPSPNQGGATQGQANRRQVLFDFENVFRGLGQGVGMGGVEVVMSMEEIMGGTGGNAANLQPTAAVGVQSTDGGGNAPQPIFGRNIYLAPMPWAGPPSAEFLQNIVTSVLRQGILPGVEGVALHVPGLAQAIQSQLQAQLNNSGQAANAGQAANTGQAANAGQAPNAGQAANTAQTANASQAASTGQAANVTRNATVNHATNGRQNANAGQAVNGERPANTGQPANTGNAANSQGAAQPHARTNSSATPGQNQSQGQPGAQRQQSNLPRAAASRGQNFSMADFLIYDRFLHCDSVHAGRRLQRRREQQQNQTVAQERMRVDRAAAVDISALRFRNTNMTQDFINVMVELLHAEPSPESWYNALMVAVARNLFLPESVQMLAGEPALVPTEFEALRLQLRSYIQDLLNRCGPINGENVFEEIAEFLVQEHTAFLNNMRNLTPMVSDVDVIGSVRMLVRSRLPTVIASVMSDLSGEAFATRFYGIFSRFFSDTCALITLCCRDGVMGLRVIYTAYIEDILQDFEPAVHDMLLTISIDNLNGLIPNLRVHTNNVRQFMQFRPRPAPASQPQPTNNSQPPRRPSAMGQSPPTRDEPMQSSPQSIHLEAERDDNVDSYQLEMPNLIMMPPLVALPTVPVMPTLPHLPMHATAPVRASTSTNNASVNAAQSPATPSNVSRPLSRAAKPTKPDMTTTPRNTTEPPSNIQLVSPMMILQHWGEDWVPVFTRDQQSQRDEPVEPYSDGYLTGMPSRKRRCVRQARPPTTLDGFMNESVREAADRPTTMDNSAIRTAFREHMRNMARNRASNSDDYDPSRYASAARFLNSSRSGKQQQPESSSESKDK